jgi:hypothetical protein
MVTKIMERVSITAFLLVVSWRPVASYLIPLDFVVCLGFVMGVLALFFIRAIRKRALDLVRQIS